MVHCGEGAREHFVEEAQHLGVLEVLDPEGADGVALALQQRLALHEAVADGGHARLRVVDLRHRLVERLHRREEVVVVLCARNKVTTRG